MRIEGTLTTWNDKREFGYISPTQGGAEIFVHISALPIDDHMPTVGERLSFEAETGKDRKTRAKNVRYSCRRALTPDPQHAAPPRHDKKRILGVTTAILVLLGLAAFGFSEPPRRSPAQAQKPSTPRHASAPERSGHALNATEGATVRR